ncbi:P-loop containing nucleoside triphosphate hydrolase protein [Auriculariales sp. MPI-PUGE-AT-0066]|nr:P-loop containing nucleoside triphosphate hydrolase protein [Auriculariales sp. MPI-PUGE-AT-0066]
MPHPVFSHHNSSHASRGSGKFKAHGKPNGNANGQRHRHGDQFKQSSTPGKANGKSTNGHVNGVNGHHANGNSGANGLKRKARQVDLDSDDESSQPPSPQRRGGSQPNPLLEQRKQLPIWSGRDALINEIRGNDTVVILGETGSGKTTQVPQFLLDAGFAGQGMIAVTQPRRVAATSLAARVAAEQRCHVGQRVGYSVRFDEKASQQTKIKFVTDGMLVRELLADPLLQRYSVIVVDEAHERTLRTDMLLASLKDIQKARKAPKNGLKVSGPLKIVIMSATLDAEKFSKYYNDAKILYVKGRQHTVQIMYTKEPQVDYVDSALRTFFQIHTEKPAGDVLVFLPGQEDIEGLEKSIELHVKSLPSTALQVLICPMYASLPAAQQSRVFQKTPANTRKVVLATNIAETSITIPAPISKSSAMQRAGRAGREDKGWCYRLYTEKAYLVLPEGTVPEIQRCDLTSGILQFKALGMNPEEVDFMDSPDPDAVRASLMILHGLGATNPANGAISDAGKLIAAFPLDPPLAAMVMHSRELGCTREVLDIVSVLSSSAAVFFDASSPDAREAANEARAKFKHAGGDHMTLRNVLVAYEAVCTERDQGRPKDWCARQFVNERALREARDIRNQLEGVCTKLGLDPHVSCRDDSDPVLRCVIRGSFLNSAMLQPDGSYKQTVGGQKVKVHPSSTMLDRKVPVIVYNELVFTNQTYARVVSSIPKAFLLELPIFQKQTARQ